ncbi:MAG: HD domain-containing protein [Candidatus Omnitrophica bacterium]|nr:HD domain-containing protein [Candidatus Omnitrophota bacterium]
MKELEHQKDLYNQLVKSDSFKKETSTLKSLFKASIWWLAEESDKMPIVGMGKPVPLFCTKNPPAKAACVKRLHRILNTAKTTKKPVRFDCGTSAKGICIPIVQGDRVYGYIGICHSRSKISADMVSLFSNFIDGLIREFQKESELAKLYETIRPRAIALSTIHTIHRILSSTLHIDELLPKMARLCLQVLRAERCCIFLANGNQKPTVIHVAANGGNGVRKETGFDKRRCARLIRNEVLAKGKIIMNKNTLCVPLTDEDVVGAICAMGKNDKTPFNIFDKEILTTLSEQAAIAIKNAKLYKEQEDITLGSIKSLAAILATRAHGNYKPKESFIKIILAIGRELQLGPEDLRNLHYAALLHDAGQIGFPDKILTKRAKLTGKEYDIIKRHPKKSVSIIKHLSFLQPVIPIILHHHENYDGSGYPQGLKGNQIPLGAKIMAVAGAFNAMITKRPYRQKIDIENAISEIQKGAGSQFDPEAVKAFLRIIREKDIVDLLKANR